MREKGSVRRKERGEEGKISEVRRGETKRTMVRLPGLYISDRYMGIVELLKPFPIPVPIRPTRSWASVVEGPRRMVSIIIVVSPAMIMFLWPNYSPKKKLKSAPATHPKS